jgi:peptidoglycan/xylan/chitin deacetylase (PgdA/CDA1 family)
MMRQHRAVSVFYIGGLLFAVTAILGHDRSVARAAGTPIHRPAQAAPALYPAEGGSAATPGDGDAPAPPAAQLVVQAPVNVTGRRPNELGRVLILEYHRIWNPEAPWQRTPAGFRRDLQRLYESGFRSVSMADVLANRIDLPLGTSPVVFTFDDSYVSQLWFARADVPARDSAVGIMQEFAAEHPDFGVHGVFYITWNTLFGGPGAAGTDKLRWLVDQGFELGNHTMSHANFGRIGAAAVQQEIGQEQALVRQALGGYEMSTIALPYGAWPADRRLAVDGAWSNQRYHFDAVLQVGSEPAPAPASAAFNPNVLPRVQAGEALLTYWLNWFDSHPDERYVSDGDSNTLTFPARLASLLRAGADQRWQMRSY